MRLFSWCSDETSSVPVCGYCLLNCHWAPLKRAWLCSLCIFNSGIYRHWKDTHTHTPSHLFARLNSPIYLILSSEERYSHPLIILVVLCWTLSSVPRPLLYWGAILDLSGTELNSPAATHTVLYSALVARTTLVSHQCCVYCWAILAQHQDFLQSLPKSQQAGGE